MVSRKMATLLEEYIEFILFFGDPCRVPNSHNQFGDESLTPSKGQNHESLEGVPTEIRPQNPPLPPVEPFSEAAPRPARPTTYRPPQAETHGEHYDSEPDQPIQIKRPFNWFRLVVWLLAIPLSLAICYYLFNLRQQMAEEAMELSFKPAKARLRLSTEQEWQDLGFSLNPGDEIAITASGKYFNSGDGIITAEGVPGSEGENRGSRSFDPVFPHGCVIARTRGKPTQVFHIGSAGILKTDVGGRLQVRVNDLDLLANKGKLIIEARTFYRDPPNGEVFRGFRDSAITPIKR